MQSVYEDVARDTNRWVCQALHPIGVLRFEHPSDLCINFAPEHKIFEPFHSNFFIAWRRGHTVQAVLGCFELSKDAGFKIVTHMMPNLPNVDMQRDFEQFRWVSFVFVKRRCARVFSVAVSNTAMN